MLPLYHYTEMYQSSILTTLSLLKLDFPKSTIFFVDFSGVLGEDWHEVVSILHLGWAYVQHWEMLAPLRHIDISATVITVAHHYRHLERQRRAWEEWGEGEGGWRGGRKGGKEVEGGERKEKRWGTHPSECL